MLPKYLEFGLTKEQFMDSCPKELKPYNEAIKLRHKQRDSDNHNLGKYIEIAVASAIGLTFGSSNAKSIYPETPFFANTTNENKEVVLSEDEKKQRVEKLFASLQIMQHNFNNNQK